MMICYAVRRCTYFTGLWLKAESRWCQSSGYNNAIGDKSVEQQETYHSIGSDLVCSGVTIPIEVWF